MGLIIYMKSGNSVIVDKVLDWKLRYDNDQITSIRIEQKIKGFGKCKNRLLVGSIDLKQIECIVEQK